MRLTDAREEHMMSLCPGLGVRANIIIARRPVDKPPKMLSNTKNTAWLSSWCKISASSSTRQWPVRL